MGAVQWTSRGCAGHLSRVLVAAAIVAGTAPAVRGQASETSGSGLPLNVAVAQQFVLAAYPDLRGRAVQMLAVPAGQTVVVRVIDPPARFEDGRTVVPLVEATVGFDAAGEIVGYQATGVLLDSIRHDQLWEQVRVHPEWTAADVEGWMVGVGGPPTVGRSAPGAEALDSAPWRRYLASTLAAQGSRFRWRADGAADTAAPPVAVGDLRAHGVTPPASMTAAPPLLTVKPVWRVDAVGTSPQGQPIRYRLEFEPFGGRLVGAVRQ
jgi:hypothetical protein